MKTHSRLTPSATVPDQPSAKGVAERIRTLRRQRGWSLADVERISRGSLKAVVLGSYERGDRAISLNRAIEIANIFSIPLTHLLAAPQKAAPVPTRATMMIDLRRVRSLVEQTARRQDQALRSLSSLVIWIANLRCDWNGEIMSLRESDRSILALMTMMNEDELLNWLSKEGILATELSRP